MCEHLSLSLSLSLSFHARDEDEYGLEEDEADALRKHSGGDKHHAPAEATHFNSHHEGEEEESLRRRHKKGGPQTAEMRI